MKLLTTELTRPFTVFSIDEPSLNNSFSFSIQGPSALRLTVNATDQYVRVSMSQFLFDQNGEKLETSLSRFLVWPGTQYATQTDYVKKCTAGCQT